MPGEQALPSLLLSSVTFENGPPVVIHERVSVDARARLHHKAESITVRVHSDRMRCDFSLRIITSKITHA